MPFERCKLIRIASDEPNVGQQGVPALEMGMSALLRPLEQALRRVISAAYPRD